MSDRTRILLTGRPGCGKTTVILKTLELLDRPTAGFYTTEVRTREGRNRFGFDVYALDGRRGPLARVGAPGPRVGRYAVDLRSFEKIGVRALEDGLRRPDTLLVVDELGKMEFLSRRFVDLLPRVVSAPNPLLGTIMLRPDPVADSIRERSGIDIVHVDARNRDALPNELARQLDGSGGL